MTKIDTNTNTESVSTEAVERLLDNVTPGPWRDAKSYRGIVSDSPSGNDDAESVYAYGGHMVCESVMDHNRPFIAAARDLVPALLAERDALAKARAEADRAFTLSDGQRMLRKQDILTVCDTPDLCFEHDDSVARCGPCAAKLAERAGVALNQYTVSNPEAMRLRRDLNRAEAVLATNQERDALAKVRAEAMREAAGYCADRAARRLILARADEIERGETK